MRRSQAGLGLVELLVGIAIGLIVVSAALGAILIARTLSGTVSEVSTLQQQGAYAFRVIGHQVRQAGGRSLKNAEDPTEYAQFDDDLALSTYLPVKGKASPTESEYALEVAYQNSEEKAFPLVAGKPQMLPLLRNCLGEPIRLSTSPVVLSRIKREGDKLVCAGSADSEVIVSGVADFQVRYIQNTGSNTQPTLRHAAPSDFSSNRDWMQVYAVEVCLELVGTQRMDTAGDTYTRCDQSTASRGDRLHMVFRTTFYVNNRVWLGGT